MHRPHAVLRVHVTCLSMTIHDLDLARPVVGPNEADAPLCVDPNAVLPGSTVAPQRVQQGQPARRLIRGAVKRRDATPLEETSRSPVLEASYYVIPM